MDEKLSLIHYFYANSKDESDPRIEFRSTLIKTFEYLGLSLFLHDSGIHITFNEVSFVWLSQERFRDYIYGLDLRESLLMVIMAAPLYKL